MPILPHESVPTPYWQFNGHLQTIAPNFHREVNDVSYHRERIATWDDDFLDLDWSTRDSKTVVILSHGLAGSSAAPYIKGLVRAINTRGWDALAWNYRGCSGEPNKHLYAFHGGKTDDLDWVVRYVHKQYSYDKIFLIGVSMGGNITLKYLGESKNISTRYIQGAVTISTPVDLNSAAQRLEEKWNRYLYSYRYLRQYKEMLLQKSNLFAKTKLDLKAILASANLTEFTRRFIVPCFGFKNLEDYLKSQSSKPFLKNIRVPTLLINADNDPFLTRTSYPYQEASKSKYFYFLETNGGGHSGFATKDSDTYTWSEQKTIRFLEDK